MTQSMQSAPPRRKGWQGRRPRPRRAETVVWSDEQPVLELDVYRHGVVRRVRRGQSWQSDVVTPAALAQVCARLPHASGLLTPNILGTGWDAAGTPYFVQYLAPQPLRVMTADQVYLIPAPPLVLAGCGMDYRLWALAVTDYPTQAQIPLWIAPFPNCGRSGKLCWGNVPPPPPARPHTLRGAVRLFLEESVFNGHDADHKSVAYPENVMRQWQEVMTRQAPTYPLDDLFPAERSLQWLLTGGPWGAAS